MAMVVGSFPLMLTPIVVAMKDLPLVYEEAAECLGATTLADLPQDRLPAHRTWA